MSAAAIPSFGRSSSETVASRVKSSLRSQMESLIVDISFLEKMLPSELNPNIDGKTPAVRAAESFPIESIKEMSLNAERSIDHIQLAIESLKDPGDDLTEGWQKIRAQFLDVRTKVAIALHHRENDIDIVAFERDVAGLEEECARRFAKTVKADDLVDLLPLLNDLNDYIPTLQQNVFTAPKFLPVRCADHCVMASDLSKRVTCLFKEITSICIEEGTIDSSTEIE